MSYDGGAGGACAPPGSFFAPGVAPPVGGMGAFFRSHKPYNMIDGWQIVRDAPDSGPHNLESNGATGTHKIHGCCDSSLRSWTLVQNPTKHGGQR